MITLDTSDIYACAFLGILAVVVLSAHVAPLVRAIVSTVRPWTLKHLSPFAISRRRFFGPISRRTILLVALFVACLAAANIVGVSSPTEAGARSGRLCVVNLVPLYLTTQFSLAADLFSTTLQRIRLGHRIIGFVCFFEGLLHVLLTGLGTSLKDQFGLFGVLAGVSICLLATLPVIRRREYEIFFGSHVALAIFLAVSLWLHLTPKLFSARFYVGGALCLLLATTAVRLVRIAHHNCGFILGRGKTDRPHFTMIYGITFGEKELAIKVRLTRPWSVTPGQYVYLNVPSISLTSMFQSHPFMIVEMVQDPPALELALSRKGAAAWTGLLKDYLEELRPGDKELSLEAKKLHLKNEERSPREATWAIVDGPYGKAVNFASFGTVVAIATDMGIFAHISHLRSLLDGMRTASVNTRKIKAAWHIRRTTLLDMAEVWMQHLLDMDEEKVLRVRITHHETIGYLQGRVEAEKGDLDPIKHIQEETRDEKDSTRVKDPGRRVLVLISADESTRDRVRAYMAEAGTDEQRKVHVVELDYQPEVRRRLARALPEGDSEKSAFEKSQKR